MSGFGIAVIFGGTVGVGILRLPGTIAGEMGSFWPIMLMWLIGGAYALLGAISIAELGTAMPQAGGFYVYSRRAFGPAAGFAMGWADWLNNCAVVAFGSVAAAEYLAALFPRLASRPDTSSRSQSSSSSVPFNGTAFASAVPFSSSQVPLPR